MLDIHINPITIDGTILPDTPIYHGHFSPGKNIMPGTIELERKGG